MNPRRKTVPGPKRPAPPWIPAALMGIGLNALAAGVIALSGGVALGAAWGGVAPRED